MAYYIVNHGGNNYVNLELAQSYQGLSANDIVHKILLKELQSKVVLDCVLVGISDEGILAIEKIYTDITYQDLDMELGRLRSDSTSIPYLGVMPTDSKVWVLNKTRFVKFSSLKVANKYNIRSKIPHIRLCGSIYAALDSRWEDETPCYRIYKPQ